jgi:hypothetical protein
MAGISKTRKVVLDMIDVFREKIINGECDDDTIMVKASDLGILNADSFKEDEYLNYDEAIKELGISYNRNKLSELAKKHGVKNRTFNSMHVGFHKDDIKKLKLILERDKKLK